MPLLARVLLHGSAAAQPGAAEGLTQACGCCRPRRRGVEDGDGTRGPRQDDTAGAGPGAGPDSAARLEQDGGRGCDAASLSAVHSWVAWLTLASPLAGTVRAFFRGNGTNVLKIAPETAIKLTFNDRIKRTIVADLDSITPMQRMCCGALAGAVAQVWP